MRHQHYVTATASEKHSHTHTPERCHSTQQRKIQRKCRGVKDPSIRWYENLYSTAHTSADDAIYTKHCVCACVCVCVCGAVREDSGRLIWQCVCKYVLSNVVSSSCCGEAEPTKGLSSSCLWSPLHPHTDSRDQLMEEDKRPSQTDQSLHCAVHVKTTTFKTLTEVVF